MSPVQPGVWRKAFQNTVQNWGYPTSGQRFAGLVYSNLRGHMPARVLLVPRGGIGTPLEVAKGSPPPGGKIPRLLGDQSGSNPAGYYVFLSHSLSPITAIGRGP